MSTSRLITRNLRASPFRTSVVVLTVAVVVSLTFSATIIGSGVRRSTEVGAATFGADMMLLPPTVPRTVSYQRADYNIVVVPQTSLRLTGNISDAISHLPEVLQVSPQLYVTSFNTSTSNSQISLIAFDPKTDFTVTPWLSINQQISPTSREVAIAGSATGLATGQSVTWGGVQLQVAVVLRLTNTSLDQTVFFPIQTAYEVAQRNPGATTFKAGEITGVMIRLQHGVVPEKVAHGIEVIVKSFRLVEASGITQQTALETRGVATYELLVGGVIAFAFVLLIGSLFSLIVNERRRQVGVIRSLGATRGYIFTMILVEMAIVAIIGSTVGLIVGASISYLAALYLQYSFQVTILQPLELELIIQGAFSLLLGMMVGMTAAAYPAFVASRLDPYEAIRTGE